VVTANDALTLAGWAFRPLLAVPVSFVDPPAAPLITGFAAARVKLTVTARAAVHPACHKTN